MQVTEGLMKLFTKGVNSAGHGAKSFGTSFVVLGNSAPKQRVLNSRLPLGTSCFQELRNDHAPWKLDKVHLKVFNEYAME
jgi:hypothetical protein